jgi:hypothetical protein
MMFLTVCIYPQEKNGYKRVPDGVTAILVEKACARSVN